jgi:hypothetical protein
MLFIFINTSKFTDAKINSNEMKNTSIKYILCIHTTTTDYKYYKEIMRCFLVIMLIYVKCIWIFSTI